MLDFYGMKLANKKTGEVKRAKHWEQRYLNLNICSHNNLRISRILASLGHLGFRRWKVAWINFLEQEIFENKKLPSCGQSFKKFWVKLRDTEKPGEEEFLDSSYYLANFGKLAGEKIEAPSQQEEEETSIAVDMENFPSAVESKEETSVEIEQADKQ